MKRFFNFIENNFSIVLTSAIPLGLLFPYFSFLRNYLTHILMLVLFITFLRIDLEDVLHHLKKPLTVVLILGFQLVILPIVAVILLFVLRAPSSHVSAFLLFSALPAGVASPAITELLKGDTPLSIVITILSHFAATVTIPLLFFILLRRVVKIDYGGVFFTLAKLIVIPLVLSVIFGKVLPKLSSKVAEKGRLITIIPMFLISFTVMSVNRDYIFGNPLQTAKYVFISYPFYFLFLISTYLVSSRLPIKERIAISTTKTFVNITIGIVLAMSFLSPQEALIVTMAQIPWSTMILPQEIALRKVFHYSL